MNPTKESSIAGRTAQRELAPVMCTMCGGYTDDMKGCGRCLIPYCSYICQRKHWRTHKLVCGRDNAPVDASAPSTKEDNEEERERQESEKSKKESEEREEKAREEAEAREQNACEEAASSERKKKEEEERQKKEEEERKKREAEVAAKEKKERERREAIIERESREREAKLSDEEKSANTATDTTPPPTSPLSIPISEIPSFTHKVTGEELRSNPMSWEQWDSKIVFEPARVKWRVRLRQVCHELTKRTKLPVRADAPQCVCTTVRTYAELLEVLRVVPNAATPYFLMTYNDDRKVDRNDSPPIKNCKEVRVAVREALSVGDEGSYCVFIMPVPSWRNVLLCYEFDDDFRAGLEWFATKQTNKTPTAAEKAEASAILAKWEYMCKQNPYGFPWDEVERMWKAVIDLDGTVSERFIFRGNVILRVARQAHEAGRPTREVVSYYERAMADYARAWLLEPDKARAAYALSETVREMQEVELSHHISLPFSNRHLFTVTRDLLQRVGCHDMVGNEIEANVTTGEFQRDAVNALNNELLFLDELHKHAFGYGSSRGLRNAVWALTDAAAWLRLHLTAMPEGYGVVLSRVGSRVLSDERCQCCGGSAAIFRSPLNISDAIAKRLFAGPPPRVLVDELDREMAERRRGAGAAGGGSGGGAASRDVVVPHDDRRSSAYRGRFGGAAKKKGGRKKN